MPFLILFIIPALIGMIAFRVLPGISWKEFLLQMVAQAVVAGLSVSIIYNANTLDTEILNGVVSSKQRVEVNCSHSYRCPPCYTTCSGKAPNRICTEHCRTCYRHLHDYDWTVFSSIRQETDIPRIDDQGINQPPRWTVARIGEPYHAEHEYTNFIKAAPGSLFRRQGLADKYAGKIPEFPAEIYDYYRRNSLVLINGSRVDDPGAWNQGLAEINGRLGSRKQVDVILVLVKDLPQEFFYALEQEWIGGRKNAAVLAVGVNRDLAPQWATVMGWTSNEMFKVHLRDSVMDLPRIERTTLLPVFEREVVQYYKRKPMSDFEYLASSIAPTPTQWTIGMVIGLLVCLALTWMFHVEDVFGDERL